jgi:hypothetical protein
MTPLTFFNIGSHPVYVTWEVFGDIVGLNSPNTETIAAGLLNDDICSSDVCSTTIGTKYGNHGNRTHRISLTSLQGCFRIVEIIKKHTNTVSSSNSITSGSSGLTTPTQTRLQLLQL